MHSTKSPKHYPIDIPGGYYCRNETEYQMDNALRDEAKKLGKYAMQKFISDQIVRNSIRRMEDRLDVIYSAVHNLISQKEQRL